MHATTAMPRAATLPRLPLRPLHAAALAVAIAFAALAAFGEPATACTGEGLTTVGISLPRAA